MFLVTCNDAFGYTHEQVLDSSFAIITGMLQEHGYVISKRNSVLKVCESEAEEEEGEWIEITDFVTGKLKRVRKVNSI